MQSVATAQRKLLPGGEAAAAAKAGRGTGSKSKTSRLNLRNASSAPDCWISSRSPTRCFMDSADDTSTVTQSEIAVSPAACSCSQFCAAALRATRVIDATKDSCRDRASMAGVVTRAADERVGIFLLVGHLLGDFFMTIEMVT